MLSIRFSCLVSKANKKGESPVQLWVNCNGSRTMTYLDIHLKPSIFQQQIRSRRQNPVQQYCDSVRWRILDYYSSSVCDGKSLTSRDIIEFVKNNFKEKQYMLYTLLDDYLRTVQTRVEHEISDCTYIKYNLVVKRFKEAVANKPLKRLKQSDILAFKRHLQYTTKLSHNTLCNYLSKAKTIFTYAVDNNLIDNNPFRNITIRMEEQEINPLTNEELERIRTQSLPTERLIHARDCFVFAANTALAFSDMASIVPEDIREQDGVYYIKKRRIKTGVFYVIPLNNTAMEILRRYGFRLPLGSLQSYNLILKEIGKICGISKRLTSHLARHTAATLMLNAGISMEIVSKILGHSNLRMTAHYAKLMDKTILNTKIEF